jgi:hypothetical protein
MIPFDTNQCVQEQGRQVIESIYKLESSIINFKGTMVATEIYKNPRVFIPVSYFQFWDDKIVSFASYKVHKSIAGHL